MLICIVINDLIYLVVICGYFVRDGTEWWFHLKLRHLLCYSLTWDDISHILNLSWWDTYHIWVAWICQCYSERICKLSVVCWIETVVSPICYGIGSYFAFILCLVDDKLMRFFSSTVCKYCPVQRQVIISQNHIKVHRYWATVNLWIARHHIIDIPFQDLLLIV